MRGVPDTSQGWRPDPQAGFVPPHDVGRHNHKTSEIENPGIWTPGASFPSSPAPGDLFYETDTDRLWAWKGTKWNLIGGNPPTARFHILSPFTQSIPHTVFTTVVFNAVIEDTDSAMNTSTGIYTLPIDGLYQVDMDGAWNSGIGGIIEYRILVDGAQNVGSSEKSGPPGADGSNNAFGWTKPIGRFSAGQTVDIQVRHVNTTGTTNQDFSCTVDRNCGITWIGN